MQIEEQRGAKCGAICGASGAIASEGMEMHDVALDAELMEVVARWDDLPEALRAGILAMVRAAN